MSLALLFPGQGVNVAAVAGEWYARSTPTRALLDQAARHVGIPVGRLLHASGHALQNTATYQPVLTALSIGALLELTLRGVRADVVAGHSLGEIAALVAASAIHPEDAVALAATRGRAMARAAAESPGGMLALGVRSRAEVDEAVACARLHGRAQIAAHNAPDEWVLAGDWPALRAVPPRFAPVPLHTGGAWHSVAMEAAMSEYRTALGAATIGALSPADRAALRAILPHMVRGTAILTRLLRRRRATRPAVRAVPTIVRGTAQQLRRRAAAGQPVTRRTAARVMAAQTRRTLANPRLCTAAVRRNVRGAQTAQRTAQRSGAGVPRRIVRG